jgi:hypothetical protein
MILYLVAVELLPTSGRGGDTNLPRSDVILGYGTRAGEPTLPEPDAFSVDAAGPGSWPAELLLGTAPPDRRRSRCGCVDRQGPRIPGAAL